MIPCLCDKSGLSLLAGTADQRALLGEDAFLKTHMPMSFVQYHAGNAPTTWTESDLLKSIALTDGVPRGNRVFLLYGAAGSGKSEALRWLQSRLRTESPTRARSMVRIPRTVLDPVLIVDSILRSFTAGGLEAQIGRWASLKQKPVALANQVIWGALGDLLDKDREIIPLSYKLRPIVEANLRIAIARMNGEIQETPFELLTREQLRTAMQDSSLQLDFQYEALLARMREEFDQAILGDVRLAPTLRSLSELAVERDGMRPIILIDDLVQSMNVYASDLLDYFLTLDEGDWDVLIGLTPASFEGTERTRELLQRVNQLDTVDDRVTRLYLSDERGDDSSFLRKESIIRFVEPYLAEIKRAHGFRCDDSCLGYATCLALQFGQAEDARLAPFNPWLLQRIFSRLPRGKGKPRYLLTTIRKLLEAAHDGTHEWLQGIRDHIDRGIYAETSDLELKILVEALVPPVGEGSHDVIIPAEIVSLVANQGGALRVSVHPVSTSTPQLEMTSALAEDFEHEARASIDGEAVRNWLEGRSVNQELLKPLRLGLARWIRDTADPTQISGIGSLKSKGILRWSNQAADVDIPVALEGTGDGPGIVVPRAIGLAAFDFVKYGQAVGRAKETVTNALLENPNVHAILASAERWQLDRITALQSQLGMSLDEFAHCLSLTLMGVPMDGSLPFCRHSIESWPTTGAKLLAHLPFRRQEQQLVMSLWEDVFRVRDNIYRAARLYELRTLTADEALVNLLRLNDIRIDPAYRLGDIRLADFLARLRPGLLSLQDLSRHPGVVEIITQYCALCVLVNRLSRRAERAEVRRAIGSVTALADRLPAPLRRQIPGIALPTIGRDLVSNAMYEDARHMLKAPHEVPPGVAYGLACKASDVLGSMGARLVLEWRRNVSACYLTVSGWIERGATGPEDKQHPEDQLCEIGGLLRQYLDMHSGPGTREIRSHEKWDRRLHELEVLLPPRSTLRRRFARDLRLLRGCPRTDLDWSGMERCIQQAVRSWRAILLVGTALPEPQPLTEGLAAFLDSVLAGSSDPAALDQWSPMLSQVLRATGASKWDDQECMPLLMALAHGEDALALRALSTSALERIWQRYPHIAECLTLNVG